MVLIICAIIGAVMGSFACCQAWRIYCKEVGKQTVKGKKIGQRSLCMKCGRQLRWYENIPIVSWVIQKGRCRECGVEIGKAEILSEIAGAVMFVGIAVRFLLRYAEVMKSNEMLGEGGVYGAIGQVANGLYLRIEMPVEIVFCVVFFTLLLIIGIYDVKWQRIPLKVAIGAIVVGGVMVVIRIVGAEGEWGEVMLETVMSVGILGVSYYLLYKGSREKLVGGGDYLVGTAVGLFLGDWWLSLLTLFLSNLTALMVMVPVKKKKIAFGPFLVFACWVVFILSEILLRYKIAV